MCAGPYKKGTPLSGIVADGWLRGFEPDQTVKEARAMGYTISKDHLLVSWSALDQMHSNYLRGE